MSALIPTVVEETAQGERNERIIFLGTPTLDIYSRLLRSRT